MLQERTTITRPRVETPERWAKALQRAMDANLAYMELIAGDGGWAVSSQRDSERGYIATTQTCTCEAGRSGDPVCCHRALVRALVGVMPLPEASAEPCHTCHGRGQLFSDHYMELRPCYGCDGSGTQPAPASLPQLQPIPAGEPWWLESEIA